MGFFDLNIPYQSDRHSKDKSSLKTVRLKLTVKAMELGYTGVAYNHSIRGIMSESDRCSIPLFPLSSIIKLAPYLSSSVKLHRELLGVPVSTPFRQYTRLTVVVENPAQAAALNSGNPILKTYDIVAVRPLNQNAFEQACQTSQVDMIAIDFSEKLPFRLKQSMVKAAIEMHDTSYHGEPDIYVYLFVNGAFANVDIFIFLVSFALMRGVYFEITYSSLIMDAQVRRQVISNAKLLVDWTRGKNIIISSAASSVAELRGPYDAANLLCLIGLQVEQAKAAISINCRTLLTSALRKKQYHKEAIKVELLPSLGKGNSEKPEILDWLNWDPISSGEGDLLLDDMKKSFSTSGTATKVIFSSVVNGLPAHGLQIKDFLPAPQPRYNGKDAGGLAQFKEAVARESYSTESVRLDLPAQEGLTPQLNALPTDDVFCSEDPIAPYLSAGTLTEFADFGKGNQVNVIADCGMQSSNNPDACDISADIEMHDLQPKDLLETAGGNNIMQANATTDPSKRYTEMSIVCADSTTVGNHTAASCTSRHPQDVDSERQSLNTTTDDGTEMVVPHDDISSAEGNHELPVCTTSLPQDMDRETHSFNMAADDGKDDTEMAVPHNDITSPENCIPPTCTTLMPPQDMISDSCCVDTGLPLEDAAMNQVLIESSKIEEGPLLESCNMSRSEDVTGQQLLREENVTATRSPDRLATEISIEHMEDANERASTNDWSFLGDTKGNEMENDSRTSYQILGGSLSGKCRTKPRISPQPILFPFKRLLSPGSRKKKSWKINS